MNVLSTTPANNTVGVSLATTVTIVFDEEVDFDSIRGGSLVVSSTANKLLTQGPGLEDLEPGSEDLLDSNVFNGFINGEITTADNITFVFAPTSLLEPNRTYKVVLGTGIVTKTIEDIVPAVGNTSTGGFRTVGPYTGDGDTFTIEIQTGGPLGTATFTYTKASNGLESEEIPTDRLVQLEDGVELIFTSGNFVIGDIWTFNVLEGVPLDDVFTFSFVTGSADYTEINPETPSIDIRIHEIHGIKRIDGFASTDGSTLALVETNPGHQQSNTRTSQVVLTFNKDIDPTSLADAVIEALMENLPMDEELQQSIKLRITATVDGKKLNLRFTG